jgi:protoporphyrinogen oxidase
VLAAQVVEELNLIGLIRREQVVEWRVHRLPFAYPVYSMGYAREVAIIKNGLASFVNLDTLGRAGNFFYSHLHDQLRLGKDYVNALAIDDESGFPLRRGNDESSVANLSL